jgi:hypothetical protein
MDWTKDAWNTFHIIALEYELKSHKYSDWLKFIEIFRRAIVCDTCKMDFAKILATPTSNKMKPFTHSVYLHNMVNIKLNKPRCTLQNALNKYSSMPSIAINQTISDYAKILIKYVKKGDVNKRDVDELFHYLQTYL